MRASEIVKGERYLMKVSGAVVEVRVDDIRESAVRGRTVYDCTNVRTGRRCRANSAAKFRGPAMNRGEAARQVRETDSATELEELGLASEANTKKAIAEGRMTKEDEKRYERLEKEHLGDPDKKTGIYTPKAEATEGEQGDPFAWMPESCRKSTRLSDTPPLPVVVPDTVPASLPVAVAAPPVAPHETPVDDRSGDTLVLDGLDHLRIDPAILATLKGDQQQAFIEIVSRIVAGQEIVKLCGYAGTGKTFLLAKIMQWAVSFGLDVIATAPTHKAAGVIQSKLGTGVQVRTIHSLLGLKLEPDFSGDTGGRILTGDGKVKTVKGVVICDEASMVGSVLKEHIERIPNVVWLFSGDLAQLPPVGEDVSELLDDPDATLETVLRQAAGSEILSVATRIRQGDLSLTFERGKDVSCVEDAEALFQAALRRFDTDEYRADCSFARTLVFRNDRRRAINTRVRDLLVHSPRPYEPGEWLVMYAQFSPEKSRLAVLMDDAKKQVKGTSSYSRAWRRYFETREHLGNNVTRLHVSEEVRVRDVRDGLVTLGSWSFKVHRLTVTARGDSEYELPVLHATEVERLAEITRGLAREAVEAKNMRDAVDPGSDGWQVHETTRKSAWSLYFTLDETFAQVDYAYAMTVHKSQGSTFEHVFVDVPDLLTSEDMAQRILYTAVTRPSKSLTFYV